MPGDFEDLYDLENMDDEEIEALILEELGEYPDIDPDDISVDVEDGFVTLTGRIGTEPELQEIEFILSDVIGIANYSNEPGRTDPQAQHLLEDVRGDAYSTHDMQQAIERGQAYEPPDRPIQEGSWSEENH